MIGWIAGLLIRHSVRRLNEGDVSPMLSSYAKDAVLVFPGDHSWGGEYKGIEKIEGFLRRCVAAGLKFEIQEVMVSGWPWSAKMCIRLTDSATAADGTVVYSNRALIYAQTAWGKIRYQEDYEDTQKVAAFDEYLAKHELATV
ncbi:MAG: nuclear transport factor 2 family protein [Dehalococcoidia bacterium]